MSRFSKLYNHHVIKSFKIILGGNLATQFVSMITYSLIARRFSTEDFGYAAFFLSVTFIVSIFQSGQVYWSMISNENYEDLVVCYRDSVSCLIKTTPVLILLCIPFCFSDINKLGWTVVLVPIFSFAYCLIEINKTFANASGDHRKAVSQVFFSRSYGQLLKMLFSLGGHSGILLVIAELVANFYVGLKGSIISFGEIHKNLSTNIFERYKKHILYYSPVNFSNLLLQELPIILSTYVYGLEASGSYFLVSRLVINPLTLIGNSFAISQIKTINSYNKNLKSKKKFLLKSYGLLIAIGLIPSTIIFYFGSNLIEIFLGKGHELTADLAKTIALVLPFRLIKSMSMVSGINADLYKESLVLRTILVLTLVMIPLYFRDLTFEDMVITILVLESLCDSILALLGYKGKREQI